MLNKVKNILVLAPHTDDGEGGAGGAISSFIEQGINVYYVAFSIARDSVPQGMPRDVLRKEVKRATKQLGIKKKNLRIFDYHVRKLNYSRQDILEDMVRLKKEINPDLVLMPSLNDIHQDHSTIAQEGVRAFKNTSILGYEVLWNNLSFNTTCFIDIKEDHLKRKIKALQCYESQRGKGYVTEDFIRSLAKTRGVQIGVQYAEAFEVIRWII